MKLRKSQEEVIPLDNAALIYPTTVARYNIHVFRMSMDLDMEIVPERLLTGLENLMERFPFFAVSLHHGFFWHYLIPHHKPLAVYPERGYPCAFLHRKRGANGYLFKVFYGKKRIAVEYFHALTDGTGGLIFIKSLVAEYLRLSGIEVGSDPQVWLPSDPVHDEEFVDSFQRFYVPLKSIYSKDSSAFHYNDPKDHLTDITQVTSAVVSIEDVKAVSSAMGATITEYLAAEHLDSLQRVQEINRKPRQYRRVAVSVPVNIRRVFGSRSMRNFTLFVVVSIDPRLGHYSFEEILQQVMFQMRSGVNSKSLSKQISRNVSGSHNVLIRYTPNFLKLPLMKILSDYYGDSQFSSAISNLGSVSLPSGMNEHITRFDFHLSPDKLNKVLIAVVGIQGKMYINLTSVLENQTIIEREFLTALVRKGISVEISTNRNTGTLEM